MTIRILLVDDHKIMRDGLKALLAGAKDIAVIAEAESGGEGLEKALTLRPDVVVMDLNLPLLSGIEATRRIVSADPEQRILALSMLQDKSCIMESLKAGAKGYLLKNCAAEELLLAIRTLAAGESYLCSQITDLVIQDYTRTVADPPVAAVAHPALSARELQVLQQIAGGKSTKEIAFLLGISIKTIDVHRHNVMNKLKLHSIAGLTKYAIRQGLTPID
jgi:DNA-binding NarL/FixJ family response regulator